VKEKGEGKRGGVAHKKIERKLKPATAGGGEKLLLVEKRKKTPTFKNQRWEGGEENRKPNKRKGQHGELPG